MNAQVSSIMSASCLSEFAATENTLALKNSKSSCESMLYP